MIAKALRENVNFMWIAGGNQPDFRTVNRFRLQMKDIIEDVFFEVVKLRISVEGTAIHTQPRVPLL